MKLCTSACIRIIIFHFTIICLMCLRNRNVNGLFLHTNMQLPSYLRYQTILYSSLETYSFDIKNYAELYDILLEQSKDVVKSKELLAELVYLGFQSTHEILVFAQDFESRPEVLSQVLKSDFNLNPLAAHKIRAAIMQLINLTKLKDTSRLQNSIETKLDPEIHIDSSYNGAQSQSTFNITTSGLSDFSKSDQILKKNNTIKHFKKFLVMQPKMIDKDTNGYGIQDKTISENLKTQLDQFLHFMITPSSKNQEEPIRKATAEVYIRHAKLFIGWYLSNYPSTTIETMSLHELFPTKSKESVDIAFNFIQWLRSHRKISVTYEANMIRGLIKLSKFIFRDVSQCDVQYNAAKTYEDIPVVAELRKLYRQANKRQSTAPRASNEKLKWLSWSEYLSVVEKIKIDVENEFKELEKKRNSLTLATQRRIATKIQKYLILAFFSVIPDRQRTIRELKIGTTLQREVVDQDTANYIIKHGPEDYKTGKAYGDRPPLVLPSDFTRIIDDFINNWRPTFNPIAKELFVQPRTGNPLTQDSVYQIVVRTCFEITGKRTNPHLLRDMVVTHVRDSNASEKELEALALYMGHSIRMQRSHYDRRTLTQKVQPAVDLLHSISTKKI